MRTVILSLISGFLIACSGASQETAPSQGTDEPDFEVNWRVIKADSHIRFTALQEGEVFSGAFPNFDAQIAFDANDLAATTIHVRIPLGDVDAGNGDRNSALRGPAWFAIRSFPDAIFRSQSIEYSDAGYIVHGQLDMKGFGKDIRLPFTLTEMADGTTVMQSQITLDRTDWSVGEDPWHTDEWVSRSVSLDIQVTAEPL